jgi:hypothetical protein
MKKLFLISFFALSFISSKAADWYVNQSGAPGTFTTIQGAILVAASNDRIFVSPYDLYTENLSIAKNITIAPATPGMTIQLVGTVTITGFPARNVHIIGMKATSFTTVTGTATAVAKTSMNLTQCEGPITAEANVELNAYYCTGGYNVTMRDGRLYGSSLGYITVSDETGSNEGDTIVIIGNKITRLDWTSDNHYFFIANNFVGGQLNQDGSLMDFGYLGFNSMVYNLGYQNNILNNTVHMNGSSCVWFAQTGMNLSNVKIYNNILYLHDKDANYWIQCASATGSPDIKNNIFASPGNVCDNCDRLSGPSITNVSFEPTAGAVNYRFVSLTQNPTNPHFPANIFNNSNGKIGSLLSPFVNRGHPSIYFQDIDMSRNDPGTYGGPYSWDNYYNTGAGKARVFDLNMPAEIWPGQTPTIKAGAVHTN